jgi:hypothetical protein
LSPSFAVPGRRILTERATRIIFAHEKTRKENRRYRRI